MRFSAYCIFLLLIVSSATAQPAEKSHTSKTSTSDSAADIATARQVREEFLHAWNGYKQYAWGHDELKPLSKTYRDWHKGTLLMTPVDALDTMILMGLKKEADSTRDYIAKNLSFDQDIEVKNFEITIRMLPSATQPRSARCSSNSAR